MKITSAQFVKGVVSEDDVLEDGKPQVAFIGRSNVGKSSVINSLTGQKNLAITSSFPGRTKQINIFLLNKTCYLLDLPGYGFAKGSKEEQRKIQQLIYWYFFQSNYEQKTVVLIIDAEVGLTKTDIEMINSLDQSGKNIIIVANKIDKIKKSALYAQMQKIKNDVGQFKVIPYSAEKKIGVSDLLKEIM